MPRISKPLPEALSVERLSDALRAARSELWRKLEALYRHGDRALGISPRTIHPTMYEDIVHVSSDSFTLYAIPIGSASSFQLLAASEPFIADGEEE